MPPKPQFTRGEIASAALAIIKEQGLDALTARGLGARLGASARPIFTVFRSMDEVKAAARELAFADYLDYIKGFWDNPTDFKYIGVRTVEFGREFPDLFRLLYLQNRWEVIDVTDDLPDKGTLARECAERISQNFCLRMQDAELVLHHLWIKSLGMGTLCAIGAARFSREEIDRDLGLTIASLLMLIRSGRLDEICADIDRQLT